MVCVKLPVVYTMLYPNSDDIDQHRTHIREVLRRLHENGLYAGAHKCSFHQDTVEYLGYILLPTGLTMDPAKVQTIQDWPEPCKSRKFNHSSDSPISTIGLYMPTQILLSLSPGSPTKTPSGIFQKSVEKCSMTLRRLFSGLRY